MTSLTIWSDAGFSGTPAEELRRALRDHTFIEASQAAASNLVSGPADVRIQEADVVFGQPDPEAALAAVRRGKLRWVHLTSAGYTRYDTDVFRTAFRDAGAILTTSSSVYAEPCAQHVFAMMLAMIRQLPSCLDAQRSDRGWPMKERRGRIPLLGDQAIVLLGYGAIGQRLVELLAPYSPSITAFRRRPNASHDGTVHVVDASGLDRALARADHVVDLLPANETTLRFVSAARIGAMKAGALFYNVGRGDTVDQDALVAALVRGHLAGAYLDVTTPEPLPPEHVLWSAPNCYVTPHIAGGHIEEPQRHVAHFLRNLEAFGRRARLRDVVIS